MSSVLLDGQSTAGATIRSSGNSSVFANGRLIIVLGDPVDCHNHGNTTVCPVMIQSSGNVFANNIAVCREGDVSSCGHSGTNGSGDVGAGG
jgi:uncharacterized Zn-binding protein involved in type VI secretion